MPPSKLTLERTILHPPVIVAAGPRPSRFTLFSRVILSLLFIAVAVPLVVLLFYSSPSSDDFCKATLSFDAVPQSSILSVTWQYYTHWSPRWLTTLLESLAMNQLNMLAWYGWLLLAVMLSNLAALWYFCTAVIRLTRGAALIAAALFYLAWITNIASPGETIYWLTGAMEYQLSLSALLILISLLRRARSTAWYFALLAVLSVWIPAQHEVAGALTCCILLTGSLILLAQRRYARHWIFAFTLALLSFAIVMLAPGMAARFAHSRRHGANSVPLLWYVKHAFVTHGIRWLVRPAILLAAVCISLLPKTGKKSGEQSLPSWLVLAGVLGLGALLFEVAGVELSMGGEPPGRVIGWFQFGFWLLLMSVAVATLPAIKNSVVLERVRSVCLLLLAVSLLSSHTFRVAVMDMRSLAPAWRQTSVSRLSRHSGPVQLAQLPAKPQLFIRQAVTRDPSCWVNRCMANYIGATTVTASASREACPQ